MSIAEIDAEIRRLEASDTTMQNCTRLAILYAIIDHQKPIKTHLDSDSEFIELCSNAPMDKLAKIMDEHMECVKVTYPKEYDSIIRKIKEAII